MQKGPSGAHNPQSQAGRWRWSGRRQRLTRKYCNDRGVGEDHKANCMLLPSTRQKSDECRSYSLVAVAAGENPRHRRRSSRALAAAAHWIGKNIPGSQSGVNLDLPVRNPEFQMLSSGSFGRGICMLTTVWINLRRLRTAARRAALSRYHRLPCTIRFAASFVKNRGTATNKFQGGLEPPASS